MFERIYVALDFPNRKEADSVVRQLPREIGVKVGLELFLKEGLDYVKELKDTGYNVFLDLKFHDIPNTVYGAVSQVAAYCDIVNVHAGGGLKMMQAAKNALCDAKSSAKIVGVTILTSMAEDDWQGVCGTGKIQDAVTKRALLCKEAGLDGIVASPLEVPAIKVACGRDFLTVIPGIRPKMTDKDDQKRVATPKAALELGCDYLVIGRAITRAENPRAALNEIIKEMKESGS